MNVSPKGLDSPRIIDSRRISWLNLGGSGNETAAHVLSNPRMTLMFCSMAANALILRVYGKAKVLHPRHERWESAAARFPRFAGSRQVFELTIDLVQTFCGTGVPVMRFERTRADEDLLPFYEEKGEQGVREYWERKNTRSINGNATGIFEDPPEMVKPS